MARAEWKGAVLARSDNTLVIEGNHYFPPDSINRVYFRRSRMHSLCPWKGVAGYYNLEVDGRRNRNAAWYYRRPWPMASKIKNHVAFRHGVRIEQ